MLDGLELGEELGEQRHQRVVDDNDLVLGVVRDVDDLLGEQPHVEGVQDRAHRRRREVGLDVLLVVPHERGHDVALADTEVGQRVREAGGVAADLGVRRGPRAIGCGSDELAASVDRAAVLEDPPYVEGDVHHRRLHGGLPAERSRTHPLRRLVGFTLSKGARVRQGSPACPGAS